jgi:hypothetical protein
VTDFGALSPAKRALLERELRRRRAEAAGSTAIPRRRDAGPAPLSAAQERMWFLQQWEPDSPTFNGARAIRLTGKLDRAALESAFTAVIERHQPLRTVVAGDRELVQVVLDSWSFTLPVIPVEPGDLDRVIRDLSREPFDLTRDLTLRASLLELAPEKRVLLLRGHHISADAHSDRILFAELSELYDARLQGRAPELPQLPIQYSDFAVWQRERLQGSRLDELVAYWARQLEGAPPLLALPTDGPRRPVQRHEGRHLALAFGPELAERVMTLSREEGVTFFITMLAVFATFLYRLAGEDDVVIGSPIANRNSVELGGLIGFFTNTIALRVPLGGNPSFREAMRRARETALGAYAHQELPFDKVVEAVAPKRDPSYNPLFQVNFRAQEAERPRLALSGLRTEAIPVDIGFSRFDLALELERRPDGLTGFFEYDLDLFDPETVAGFIDDLRSLLEQIVDDPDSPILTLRLPLSSSRQAATAGGAIRRRRPT